MTRILITGGTGFIGRHLLAALPGYLPGRAIQVRVLTRDAARYRASRNVVFIQGDITVAESLKPVVEGTQWLFHLAGKTGTPGNPDDAESFWRVNVEGTRSLVRIATGSGVEVMVNLSSASVYGDSPEQVCDETTAPNPLSLYGVTKLAAEKAAEAEAAGASIRIISIRPSNVFGEDHPFNALLTMMRLIKNRRFFLLRSAIETYVNYVYVGDLVDAVIRLALMPRFIDGCYIVNTPEQVRVFAAAVADAIGASQEFISLPRALPYTIATFLEMLGTPIGWQPPLTRAKVWALANTQVFSPRKLQSVLPYWPRYGLLKGLDLLAQSYKERGLL